MLSRGYPGACPGRTCGVVLFRNAVAVPPHPSSGVVQVLHHFESVEAEEGVNCGQTESGVVVHIDLAVSSQDAIRIGCVGVAALARPRAARRVSTARSRWN